MSRDYKYRANQKKKQPQQTSIAWWKWLLIVILITLFVAFLVFLSNSTPSDKPSTKKVEVASKTTKKVKPIKPISRKQKPEEPRFDFYTILPETEVIVPDYEIDTRSREEKFGKGKASKYLIQAGSFKNFAEADKLRARLALLGMESRVEKAKIGNVLWNRVKLGPYRYTSDISKTKKTLKNNGIDTIVIEVKG